MKKEKWVFPHLHVLQYSLKSAVCPLSALSWLTHVNFTSFVILILELGSSEDESLWKSLICVYLNSQIPPLCKLIIRLKD